MKKHKKRKKSNPLDMYKASNNLVDLEVMSTGDLCISFQTTRDVRQERAELWNKYLVLEEISYQDVVNAIFEDIGANSEYELLPERDYLFFGLLTSAPVIAFGVDRGEDGDTLQWSDYTRVWIFWDYETKDDMEDLLRSGKVIFQKVEFEEGGYHMTPEEDRFVDQELEKVPMFPED